MCHVSSIYNTLTKWSNQTNLEKLRALEARAKELEVDAIVIIEYKIKVESHEPQAREYIGIIGEIKQTE